ncbi:hypothetical protein TNIN_312751 [Trichonephila inaurata madagascariensis]|uniref:Uncharacterized protein n=1 Tax=Trichonephila inaurata madagascariensis TaxID=2747483 RepID=A0A8X6YTQ1_9ARAC|nr:hypothetical protein TNIN_312751 [Trichonephila inaurata madagascariensis]
MGYRCHNCNLEFTDFEEYLDHECKSCKARKMTSKEARTLENLFHICKTANKSHIGNISVNEEKNMYLKTDTSLEVGGQHFNSNDYSVNQLRYQTLNERDTSLTGLDNFESYVQTEFPEHQLNPEVNFNTPSSKQTQMSEINEKINNNHVSASLDVCPKQFFNCAIDECYNTNHVSVPAEYGKMQYAMRDMNPKFNTYKPFVSSEYNPFEFVSYGMNQNLEKKSAKSVRSL